MSIKLEQVGYENLKDIIFFWNQKIFEKEEEIFGQYNCKEGGPLYTWSYPSDTNLKIDFKEVF